MISIVIPTYKRLVLLRRTLDNLTSQTSKEFEVVVVNDDHLNPLELDVSVYDYEVKIINNPENFGAGEARNIGVRNSRYDWIAFLDDDDLYRHDKIGVLISYIIERRDVELIYHPIICRYMNEGVSYSTRPSTEVSFNDILVGNVIGGTPGYVVRKDLFEKMNGFDASLAALEDYEFLIRVLEQMAKPLFIDQPLTTCLFYTKSKGLSKDINRAVTALKQLDKKYQHEIGKLPSKLQRKREAVKNGLLAYTYLLNLSRKAGINYFRAFLSKPDFKLLMASIIGIISPVFLIKLRGQKTNASKVYNFD
ncbi:glycosyltransferase family 2 protein [Chitinophaga polysaccharea]|uniref:glycosyltransferase family 2 protein n=1 Tax=Chitinophaga polysaccharea TaxID=1293035 RepID=UPI0014559AC1|nr:glycosyltransferase family 2 protein [Chitinophaga polysaccharea]NLR61867.1 glycosyltransferase family 2 protein [Chitinophaga polysaccharea]